jgi:hypothetical protein
MKLSMRRSQRDAGMLGNKVVFTLDAKIDPTAEEQLLIRRYKLGKMTVYNSEATQKHATAAIEYAERGGLMGLAKAAVRGGMAALSLRCTIDSLTGGQRIECQDLPELLGAEEAIREACQTAKMFLATAVTFDGREEILEF